MICLLCVCVCVCVGIVLTRGRAGLLRGAHTEIRRAFDPLRKARKGGNECVVQPKEEGLCAG